MKNASLAKCINWSNKLFGFLIAGNKLLADLQ